MIDLPVERDGVYHGIAGLPKTETGVSARTTRTRLRILGLLQTTGDPTTRYWWRRDHSEWLVDQLLSLYA